MMFFRKLALAGAAVAGLALAVTAFGTTGAYNGTSPYPNQGASSVLFSSPLNLHNLNNIPGVTISNSEICLPCHVPHGAPDAPTGQRGYIWNHTLSSATYSLNQASGTPATGSNLDYASKLCLSCHDGTVAVDSYGAGPLGSTATANTTNTMGTLPALPNGDNPDLGTDLSNSHPLGVDYPTTSTTGEWSSTSINIPPLNGIRLPKMADGQSGIGCTACHQPHNMQYNFLVMSNQGSALCLSCHIK